MADGVVVFDVELNSDGIGSALSGVGNKIAKGAAIAAAGAAVGKALSASIGAGMGFESVMSKVEALSGATQFQMMGLSEAAKQLGATTAFSASEVGNAFTYMAQAGWGTSDMLKGIAPILNLAAADGLDLATTSDIVTDSLTAFGLTAGDTAMYTDVLATAAAASNTNVAMMGESFKYAAPVAGALGYNVKDVSVAIGLMANAGIKGSQAGTALRGVLSRMAKPTKETQKAMNALGVSLTKADGSMKPFSEVMGDLRKGFAGMTEEQKASYAAMLAGQEGMSGLLAIVNASEEDYNKLTAAIENSQGAAERMAAIMMDNLAGDVENFKGAAESLAIAFYETFSDKLRKAVQAGTSIVDKLTEGVKSGDMAGALSSIFTTDMPQISAAIGKALGEAIGKLPDFLKDTGDVGKALLTGLSEGTKALAEGIATGIGDNLPTLLPNIASSILTGIGSAFEKLPEFATLATSLITGLRDALVGSGTDGAIDGISEQMAVFGQTIISSLVQSIQNLPDLALAVGDIVAALAKSLSDGMSGLADGLTGEGLSEAFSGFASALVQGLMTAISSLPDLAVSAGELITSLVSALSEGISGMADGAVGEGIAETFSDLAKSIIQGITTAISSLPDLAVSVGEIIGSLAKAIGEGIAGLTEGSYEGTAETLAENFANIAKAIVSGLAAALPGVAEGFAAVGTALLDGLKNVFVGADGTTGIVGELAQSLLDGINDFFTLNFPTLNIKLPTWSEIVTAAGDALSNITTGAKEALKTMMSIELPAWADIQDGFQTLVDEIKAFFSEAFADFWTNLFGGGGEVVHGGGAGKSFGDGGEGNGLLDKLIEALLPNANAAELPASATTANEQIAALMQQNLHQKLIEAFQNGEISYAELVAAAFGGGEEGVSLEEQMAEMYAQMEAIGASLKQHLLAGMTGGGEGGEGAAAGAAGEAGEGGEDAGMLALGLSLAKSVAKGITQGAPDIKTELTKATDAARAAVKIEDFNTLGKNIAQGVADGIEAGSSAIADALVAAVLAALGAANEAAGVHSPSTLFRDKLGRWIPAGAAEGVKMEAWQLRQAARNMVLDSVTGLSGLSRRAASNIHFGWADARLAKKAAMAAYGQPIQEVNFNVPVQTPDEFAETVELFMTYGLEADY